MPLRHEDLPLRPNTVDASGADILQHPRSLRLRRTRNSSLVKSLSLSQGLAKNYGDITFARLPAIDVRDATDEGALKIAERISAHTLNAESGPDLFAQEIDERAGAG